MAFGLHLYLKLIRAVLSMTRELNEGNGVQGSCKNVLSSQQICTKKFLTVDIYKTYKLSSEQNINL